MVAQVSYASCLMCQVAECAPLGHLMFDNMITREISMSTWSFLMKLLLMFCTLLVSIQLATSSSNTLCAMTIAFGSLMNCISSCWI
jgi:hypothetical protein